MSSRSEAPTPRRLADARKKGQFARASSVTAWASVAGGGMGLMLAWERATARAVELARSAWQLEVRADEALPAALECLGWWGLPVVSGAMLGSWVAAAAQAGWHPEWGLVQPDVTRLSPTHGIKRLFSLERTATVVRAAVFAVAVIWAWTDVARCYVPDVRRAWILGAGGWAWLSVTTLKLLMQHLLVWSAVYAAVELLLARRRHLDSLRMTREEVRREHRESEGDPVVKGQRRALHRGLANGGPARGLAHAHALVVNPTHLAVALRYAPGECVAPYVVARGHDQDALTLRREAAALGLPVFRDVPLARSLIRLEPGEEIPEELYHAAAAVLKVAQEGARP